MPGCLFPDYADPQGMDWLVIIFNNPAIEAVRRAGAQRA
jgi:hypothetical protein